MEVSGFLGLLAVVLIRAIHAESLILVSKGGRLPFNGSTIIECYDDRPETIAFHHLGSDGTWNTLDPRDNMITEVVSGSKKTLTITRNVWATMGEIAGAYRCSTPSSSVYTLKLPNTRLHVATSPAWYTVVGNKGEPINLTMTSYYPWNNPWGLGYRWEINGTARVGDHWKTFDVLLRRATPSDAGVYSVYIPQYGDLYKSFIRLIVRGCHRNKYGPRCSLQCPKCVNGGMCHDVTGECICPPGFHGRLCDQVCGTNTFGAACQHSCDPTSLDPLSCKGQIICLPDPFGCTCAPGLQGLQCDEECPANKYGAGCQQICHCALGKDACDRFTGECEGGCARGWTGVTCQTQGSVTVPPKVELDITTNQPISTTTSDYVTQTSMGDLNRASTTSDSFTTDATDYDTDSSVATAITSTEKDEMSTDAIPRTTRATVNTETITSTISDTLTTRMTPATTTAPHYSLEIFRFTQSSTVNPGDKCKFVCTARGNPPPGKDDVVLHTPPSANVTKLSSELLSNKRANTYLVSGISTDDVYNCTATTIAGRRTSSLEVVTYGHVWAVPKMRTIIQSLNNNSLDALPYITVPPHILYRASTELTVQFPSWWERGDGEGPVKHYILRYQPLGDQNWTEVNYGASDASSTQAKVNGLQPATQYVFQVLVARPGNKGTGEPSPSAIFKTCPVPPPPANITLSAERNDGQDTYDVKVTWQIIRQELIPGQPAGEYLDCTSNQQMKLIYKADGVFTPSSVTVDDGKATETYIRDISAGTRLYVQMQAYSNEDGDPLEGPKSDAVYFTTPMIVPGVVVNLRVADSRRNELRLKWREPRLLNGGIDGYLLSYVMICRGNCQPCIGSDNNVSLTVPKTSTGRVSQRLVGLESFSAYNISVRVATGSDYSEAVNIIASTAEDVPSATPRDLSINDVQFKLAVITWRPMACLDVHGRHKGYRWKLFENDLTEVQSGNVDAEDNSVVLLDLKTSTRYRFDVAAMTNADIGLYTSITFTTKSLDELGAPLSLEMVSNTETSLMVTWQKPDTYTGEIFGYEISIVGVNSFNDKFVSDVKIPTIPVEQSVTKLSIPKLMSGSLYRVSVRTRYESGWGPAVTKPMWTEIASPQTPAPPTIIEQTSNTFTLDLPIVMADTGPISGYYVVLQELKEEAVGRISRRDTEQEAIPNFNGDTLLDYDKARKNNQTFYVTAKLSSDDMLISRTLIVGDNMMYGGYHNVPLEGDNYKVYYGVASAANNVVKYSFTAMDHDVTLVTPTEPKTGETSMLSDVTIPIIAGSAVCVFVIILVILIVIIRKKRMRGHNVTKEDHGEASTPLTTIALSPSVHTNNCEGAYENVKTSFNWQKIVPVAFLPEYVNTMKKSDSYSFVEEFLELPQGPSSSWDAARLQGNLSKNRYGNIASYDHSRVVLQKNLGDPLSDYINASYIDGYTKQKAYIATQGPKHETVKDFWRMVWQENCRCIVMLTGLAENGKKKCEKYWPEHYECFGSIEVSHLRTDQFPDYTVRMFDVSKGRDCRSVTQYHFDSWPDKSTTAFATSLLTFRTKLKAENPPGSGPIIVHCSAGVGRTGSFITIDAMLEQAKLEGAVNVFDYVKKIRQQRILMVQTQAQYIFIHEVLIEALIFGDTLYDAKLIEEKFEQLQQQIDPSTGRPFLEEQFNLLHKTTVDIRGDCLIGQREVNIQKNRYQHILPLDYSRVILPVDGVEGSDYINATYVDGYKRKDMFVVTQAPLKSTVDSFWQMVNHCNSTTIISLNNWDDEPTLHEYWPLHGDEMYGSFHVETIHWDDLGDITIKTFKVVNVEKDGVNFREVKQYQLKNWATETPVADVDTFLKLIGLVKSWQHKSGNKPIIVHCTNGADRSGLLCASTNLCEQLEVDHSADVFQTCKQLKTVRPHFITSVEQFSFCYRLAIEFVTELC